MVISGTLKEIRTILERAIMVDAEFINFVAPDHIFIFHHTNNEYTYIKSMLFISHSLLLTKDAIQNMRKFIRRSWGGRNKSPNSPFYGILGETITIKEDEVIFDNDDGFSFEFNAGFVLLESVSPFKEKLDSFSSSKIEVDKPFLKIKPTILADIHKRFKGYGKEVVAKNNRINLNNFSVNEEYNLIFKRVDADNRFSYLLDNEEEQGFAIDFTVYREFSDCVFHLYDLDIFFLQQLCKARPIDNVVIIPFENFYIIEAHAEELVCKIHMKISNGDKIAQQ